MRELPITSAGQANTESSDTEEGFHDRGGRQVAGLAGDSGVTDPGDGINGIVVAFGKADDQPRFIQVEVSVA